MKDKEQTKRKLIDAVGIIIKTKGFSGVRISKVARQAGVDRKLVYRYFGNLDNLTETYVTENDFWMLFADKLKTVSKELDPSNSKLFISDTLQMLFKFFLKEQEMQNLILIELAGSYPIMRSIHNVRENIGHEILERTDDHFKNSDINFRAVAALLVGGIYYIILHTRKNGYHFADLDLKSEEGTQAIIETVAKIVDWAYGAAL
ncbi:TetR/AcrR family transcriptional regulator [Mucilaginibacter sp. OK098]|uniref:TetR/AcrR family transcriptional regulator n=1 Tax=Mucilaginibacter sp. OK098 TaxID=1855297 RepID=UPI00091A98E4|nr:TetR/AcrR family transcriptional regulator [Mucilaginibacter sp. OK098]SHM93920.1 transcriptional regulator, TetR family [Mucilaginibacter sp. OK098]